MLYLKPVEYIEVDTRAIHDDISSFESIVQKTDPKSWSAIADPVGDKMDCLRRRDNRVLKS